MKKITTLLLTLIMMLGVLTITSNAAGNGSLALSSLSGKQGDTLTVDLSLASNPGLVTMEIELNFDANVLQLVSVTDTHLLGGNPPLSSNYTSPYKIAWIDVATENNTQTGTIASFTFKIKDNAAPGASALSVTCLSSYDVDMNANTISAAQASVTVNCKAHTLGAWTNTSEEQHVRSCSACGYTEKENHTWNAGAVTKPATCKEAGTKTYTCTTCNGTKTEVIQMLDHNFGEWVKVDENDHKHTCKDCNKEETEAHKFDETLTAGEKTHWNACVCGEKKNETEHTYDETKWSSDGENHWHACSCGAKNGSAAHNWDSGKVTTAPAVQKEGVKTFTCKECGAVREEKIPALSPYGNPQTGSHTMIIAIVMAVLSAGGAVVCASFKKKTVR